MNKIAIIGGGSSYTPLLVEHIFNSSLQSSISEIALMDIDQERLKIVTGFLQNLKEETKSPIKLSPTLVLDEALKGTKIVIPQIRVGKMDARLKDEQLGLKYNIVGQETTGIGGFAKALRTIPVIKEIAEKISQLGAKDPWIVNFTNPVGIIVEALMRHQLIPTIGICNGSLTVQKGIAEVLSVPMQDLEIDYVGPNHFAFVLDVRLKGRSIFSDVLQKMQDTPQAANITSVQMAPEIMKSAKMIPTGYHKYFFHTQGVIAESRTKTLRALKVMETEKKIFASYANPQLRSIPADIKDRGGAFYNVVAMDVFSCLLGHEKKRVTVVIPNEKHIVGFEDKHTIEMPCELSTQSPRPMGPRELPIFARGLSQRIKAYEELTALAGWTGDRDLAYQALLMNPLLPDADQSALILDDVLQTFSEHLPQFKRS